MEIVNQRSALLSNFEVLTLLREHEREQLAQAKSNFLVKKEQGSSDDANVNQPLEDVPENLRTIEFEASFFPDHGRNAIQYLSAEYQPIIQQTEKSVKKLVRDLSKYDLTKAEKLQIVNLAPTEAVELYVIVEELEDRLEAQMEEILSAVQTSIGSNPSTTEFAAGNDERPSGSGPDPLFLPHEDYVDEEHEVFAEEEMDDPGGFEGDLEMDDDGE
ncbi:hypothetical protein SISNIDRAFT_482128 [Sistotremastrum niveocremeum HHB9708]|uniref:DNA-directed RNA polymerase III subunit RPC9 n=1 Tax=Sistotremastrum niveocremeum HHB9708 TaxID=1314777 RepID=A0A164YSE4_9AGAM|nr:hypothetical protein SISNIDRAFT_482128 [Sistotremastrum niveocremeum HHB9708]